MSITEDVLSAYFARYPGARQANRDDAQYKLTMDLLRRMLSMMDIAMQDEGIVLDVRTRVIRMALYGSTEDPNLAAERIHARERAVEELARQPGPWTVPEPRHQV